MASIYSRPNRKGKDVWYIDYRFTDPDTGTRVRKKERIGTSKEHAEESLQSRLTDIRRQKFDGILPEPTCLLEDIWARYLEHSEVTKTPAQVEREKGIMKDYLQEEFGAVPLNRITAEQVIAYQIRRKQVKKRAASTINKEVQLLKNICKKAVEWGYIRSYLIAGVKPFREPPGRVRYLTAKEYGELMKQLPEWLRPVAIVAAHTGMRRGNICGLTRKQVDFKRRQNQLSETKNGEPLTVPMNQTVIATLKAIPPRLDTLYLFANEEGTPVSAPRATIEFKRACRRAQVKDFRFHDLRHHFASYLTMAGHQQRTLVELLGHKDPKMTVRYQHLSQEHLQVAVESLNATLAT